MAIEIRRILFQLDEVEAILTKDINDGVAGIPRGVVLKGEVAAERPLELKLRIQSKEGRQIAHRLDTAHLNSSIVNFCLEARIP